MYVYGYYNKKAGAYEDPFISPVANDMFPKLVARGVILNQEEARKSHKFECDLFYFGTFDEVQGKFDLLEKPEFLISLSPLEVKNDGNIAC